MNIKKNPQSTFIKDWVDNSTHNINMSMKPLIFNLEENATTLI